MLSILFEILTSDDMQDDTPEMLLFLLKYEEMAYCESFFCLHSLSLYDLRPKILPTERPY